MACPCCLEPRDQREQLPGVGLSEAARRLVEAPARGSRRRAHARSRRSAARRPTATRHRRPDRCPAWPSSASAARRRLAHPRSRHETKARRFDAERDVLHHRQMRRERQLLVDHRHAGTARVERVFRTIGARRRASSRRHPAAARRREWPSACSCRRRSRRPARTPRPEKRRGRCHRRRRFRRMPCECRASRSAGRGHCDRSGLRSCCVSGWSMMSRVISRTPVSMRRSTFSPFRCATSVFTLK